MTGQIVRLFYSVFTLTNHGRTAAVSRTSATEPWVQNKNKMVNC